MDPNLLIYLVVLLAYILLRPLYTRLLKRLTALTKTEVDDKIYMSIEKMLWFLILLFLLDIIVSDLFPNLLLHRILLSLMVVLSAVILIRIGTIVLKDVILPNNILITDQKLRQTVYSVGEKIYVALIIFFAFTYIFSVWGVDITPLVASAGVMGIVVGLALKDPLENLLAGIMLLSDPPFRVGDVIRIGEYTGEVREIGIRNTKIVTFDGDLVTLPNSTVIRSEVENFHLPTDRVRIRIRVGVSYDSDPDKVKDLLITIAQGHPLVLKEPEPRVFFMELGDSALIFELWVWTELQNKLQVLSDLNTAIIKRFREEDIEIPYPIRTVYLKDLTPPPQTA